MLMRIAIVLALAFTVGCDKAQTPEAAEGASTEASTEKPADAVPAPVGDVFTLEPFKITLASKAAQDGETAESTTIVANEKGEISVDGEVLATVTVDGKVTSKDGTVLFTVAADGTVTSEGAKQAVIGEDGAVTVDGKPVLGFGEDGSMTLEGDSGTVKYDGGPKARRTAAAVFIAMLSVEK